jgi:hypothetical protein
LAGFSADPGTSSLRRTVGGDQELAALIGNPLHVRSYGASSGEIIAAHCCGLRSELSLAHNISGEAAPGPKPRLAVPTSRRADRWH